MLHTLRVDNMLEEYVKDILAWQGLKIWHFSFFEMQIQSFLFFFIIILKLFILTLII